MNMGRSIEIQQWCAPSGATRRQRGAGHPRDHQERRRTIKKRGGYLPVINELLEDSDNNIAAIAKEWLADEARVTANKEILAVIQAKEAEDPGRHPPRVDGPGLHVPGYQQAHHQR